MLQHQELDRWIDDLENEFEHDSSMNRIETGRKIKAIRKARDRMWKLKPGSTQWWYPPSLKQTFKPQQEKINKK